MYSDERSNNKLLFYIVAPMSFIVFILSLSIIILLTKSNRTRKRFVKNSHRRTKGLSPTPLNGSQTYTNNVLFKTSNNTAFMKNQNQQHLYPIKSELTIRPLSYPIYSASSANNLPPLVLPLPSSSPPVIPLVIPQSLSVRRLYKSYV